MVAPEGHQVGGSDARHGDGAPPDTDSPPDAAPGATAAAAAAAAAALTGADDPDSDVGSEVQDGGAANLLGAALSALSLPARRFSRTQAVMLVLFSLLTLGPVIALVVTLRSDTQRPDLLTEADIPPDDGVLVTFTVTAVRAETAEMGVRVQVVPGTELAEGGRLGTELTVRTNDVRGNQLVTLAEGATVVPFELVAALGEGSVSRYPFDRYTSRLQVVVTREVSDEPTVVPTAVSVRADVSDMAFTAEAQPAEETLFGRDVALELRRSGPTLLFSVWMMVLWWVMSVSAVLIVWSVAIWRATVPAWSYGLLVGALFSLPPLRAALPGGPPPGVLVDYVAFYWAIVIIGLGLAMLVGYYMRDAREAAQLQRLNEAQAREGNASTGAAQSEGGGPGG